MLDATGVLLVVMQLLAPIQTQIVVLFVCLLLQTVLLGLLFGCVYALWRRHV